MHHVLGTARRSLALLAAGGHLAHRGRIAGAEGGDGRGVCASGTAVHIVGGGSGVVGDRAAAHTEAGC